MNGKKAKMLRRVAKDLVPDDWKSMYKWLKKDYKEKQRCGLL